MRSSSADEWNPRGRVSSLAKSAQERARTPDKKVPGRACTAGESIIDDLPSSTKETGAWQASGVADDNFYRRENLRSEPINVLFLVFDYMRFKSTGAILNLSSFVRDADADSSDGDTAVELLRETSAACCA